VALKVRDRMVESRITHKMNQISSAQTLHTYAASLRGQVDLAQLRSHLQEVVPETMQPDHASLWFREKRGQGIGE
jgi:cytochrome b subunit of formate dehydrogenase